MVCSRADFLKIDKVVANPDIHKYELTRSWTTRVKAYTHCILQSDAMQRLWVYMRYMVGLNKEMDLDIIQNTATKFNFKVVEYTQQSHTWNSNW